jgi:FkbM family methyltransferase
VELTALNKDTGLFELLTIRLYQMLVSEGDTCIDAGANYGDHTFGMAKAVGRTGLVHAIEALPYLAQRINRIATEKRFSVMAHNVAVSDHIGTARFQHVKNIPGASGLWHRDHPEQPVETETLDVEVTTVDELLGKKMPSCRFFKLDIECGEYHAMRGANAVISKHKPFLTFENGFSSSANVACYTRDQWFNLFVDMAYRPFDIFGYEITLDRWPDAGQPYNSIAVPFGSKDELFVTTIWRGEIDGVAAQARAGLKWPPPSVDT